jgi:DnaJ family protein A protein 2
VPCNDCDGTGEIIDPKHKCKVCNAKKVVSERKVLEVHIDKGMKGGQQITFSGESDQAPNTIPGDVIIVVEEKPHELFRRRGDNLFCEVTIDLLTALGGGELSILHLDERALHVTLKPGEVIKDGALKRIEGQGMPSYRHHELGDLYVKLNVSFPESIPKELIPHLEQALPARTKATTYPPAIHVDEVGLSEPTEREKQSHQNGAGGGNDDGMDDDDEEGGGPQVQCAQRPSPFLSLLLLARRRRRR